jgi:RNA polymerase sigma-B factor
MSERSNEYADVPEMVRRLRALDPSSPAHRRQRDAVVARALPIAEHVARRFRGRGEAHDDLYQVACVGLVNAVDRFDPDNGADFLAFAVPTIMGEVRRYFRDHGWAVKVPRRVKDLHNQLSKARAELSQQIGRAPTPSEVAAHLGIDRETVVEATIASSNYNTVSTDAAIGGDNEVISLKDTLGGSDTNLDKVVDVETVRPLLMALPPRQRMVLRLRFFEELTQTQIAERIGCSQMHVSRILAQALGSLRAQLAAAERAADLAPAPVRRGAAA